MRPNDLVYSELSWIPFHELRSVAASVSKEWRVLVAEITKLRHFDALQILLKSHLPYTSANIVGPASLYKRIFLFSTPNKHIYLKTVRRCFIESLGRDKGQSIKVVLGNPQSKYVYRGQGHGQLLFEMIPSRRSNASGAILVTCDSLFQKTYPLEPNSSVAKMIEIDAPEMTPKQLAVIFKDGRVDFGIHDSDGRRISQKNKQLIQLRAKEQIEEVVSVSNSLAVVSRFKDSKSLYFINLLSSKMLRKEGWTLNKQVMHVGVSSTHFFLCSASTITAFLPTTVSIKECWTHVFKDQSEIVLEPSGLHFSRNWVVLTTISKTNEFGLAVLYASTGQIACNYRLKGRPKSWLNGDFFSYQCEGGGLHITHLPSGRKMNLKTLTDPINQVVIEPKGKGWHFQVIYVHFPLIGKLFKENSDLCRLTIESDMPKPIKPLYLRIWRILSEVSILVIKQIMILAINIITTSVSFIYDFIEVRKCIKAPSNLT